jgi:RNA polymerase sigma-70 factor (ECF subfamily)
MECPDTDQELIEKWRRDADATHAHVLVQRHYSRMLNLFYRLTGTRSQAEELTQDLFLRLTEQVAHGREIQQLGAWLNATALNLWRDRIRREMRARAKGISYSGGDEEIQNHAVSATSVNREEEILSSMEQQSVRDAVLRLAPKHREVVVLHHYQGLKYEEIARTLGIPVGTVRSRLHYAVDELRASLLQVQKGSHS